MTAEVDALQQIEGYSSKQMPEALHGSCINLHLGGIICACIRSPAPAKYCVGNYLEAGRLSEIYTSA